MLADEKNLIIVNDEGLKVRYDNPLLKLNYREAYLKISIEKGIPSDDEKLSRAGKEEWMEIYKEIGLPIIEFDEDFMIISWDAVEEWKTHSEMSRYSNYRIFKNSTKIRGLDSPLEIEVTDKELENYFNKIVPEKRTNKVDVTPFLKAKRIWLWICIIFIILYYGRMLFFMLFS